MATEAKARRPAPTATIRPPLVEGAAEIEPPGLTTGELGVDPDSELVTPFVVAGGTARVVPLMLVLLAEDALAVQEEVVPF